MLLSTPMREFIEKTTWKVFGTDRLHDRDVLIPAFNRHNEEVKRTIPPDRLLVYEVSQGWEPLCNFLGVPVPATPFPRVNSRDEMKTLMSQGRDANAPLDPAVLREVIKARLGRS